MERGGGEGEEGERLEGGLDEGLEFLQRLADNSLCREVIPQFYGPGEEGLRPVRWCSRRVAEEKGMVDWGGVFWWDGGSEGVVFTADLKLVVGVFVEVVDAGLGASVFQGSPLEV